FPPARDGTDRAPRDTFRPNPGGLLPGRLRSCAPPLTESQLVNPPAPKSRRAVTKGLLPSTAGASERAAPPGPSNTHAPQSPELGTMLRRPDLGSPGLPARLSPPFAEATLAHRAPP